MSTATQPNNSEVSALPLAGRVAVVTGATSGIGEATARRLAAAGASVAILGRRADRLDALAGSIDAPGEVLPVPVDVSDPEAFASAATTIRDRLGRVDLVVANAGVMLPAPFETADTAEWDQMIGTNVTGLVRTGRAFIDDLLAVAAEGKPADLVHVGSIGGHETFANYGVYCATKAAVAHLTRNLRVEFGPRGVRVKNVEPGVTGTELGEHTSDEGSKAGLSEWRDSMEILQADDIASAIAFAVSAPARMNVAELVVVPTQQG